MAESVGVVPPPEQAPHPDPLGWLYSGMPKGHWKLPGWIAVPAFVLIAFLLACLHLFGPIHSGLIARGVSISGVNLGGMSPEQGAGILHRVLPSMSACEVTAIAGRHSLKSSAAHLGASWEINPIVRKAYSIGRSQSFLTNLWTLVTIANSGSRLRVPVSIHQEHLLRTLRPLASAVYIEPRNASLRTPEGFESDPLDYPLTPVITPSRPGMKLDIAISAGEIAHAIALNPGQLITVTLPVVVVNPRVTERMLLPINGQIARFTTRYHPWQRDRTHNLALAAHAINGVAVLPGQVFSYNQQVGQRTIEKGYRSAPIFIRGEVRDDTGGGVCQVATTVYNAALLANLDIVEREHHSMQTSYAQPGRDATVAWGLLDLKFRNNQQSAVVITTRMDDGILTVSVWGHIEPGEKVRVFTEKRKDGIVTYRVVSNATGKVERSVVSRDPLPKKPDKQGIQLEKARGSAGSRPVYPPIEGPHIPTVKIQDSRLGQQGHT